MSTTPKPTRASLAAEIIEYERRFGGANETQLAAWERRLRADRLDVLVERVARYVAKFGRIEVAR